MATGKRYYWMKLKESFMTSDTIDYFMSQPDGANYVVLYQKSSLGYWTARWENGGYKYGHKDNDQLTTIYELLEVLGYEMSDEETLMRTGCADIFERCGGGEKPAMESTGLEDKSDDDFDAALRDQLKGEIGDDDGV